MKGRILTEKMIEDFSCYLKSEEKSENTVGKYLRDVRTFAEYLGGAGITKETVIAYKSRLLAENYAVRSTNSMLASLNFSELDGLQSEVDQATTAGLLPRRKGTDKGGIYATS